MLNFTLFVSAGVQKLIINVDAQTYVTWEEDGKLNSFGVAFYYYYSAGHHEPPR